ncbi:hypothetical protein G4G27_01370 [Sphingomonas sp. So64.6b]|uniref:hypothetical protein n=1 Tax=Sphingomonas sp. So64.6b TaxID=2997354 RepID=UPI0016003CDA|nr:hypothetical protein [Sphingomonas sp. So64.6b]QNA82810.1 hypothetical protein G4G27_01370 [Sphingomonas sp. So64.6b]
MSLDNRLSSPNVDMSNRIQADWLELVAYYSDYGVAALDVLISQLEMEADRENEDTSEDDEFVEDTKLGVIGEVERRAQILGQAYPFAMSADGAQLRMVFDGSVGQAIYLFSLIMAHARGSALVTEDLQPSAATLVTARDVFQICATLGAAGRTGGPAFSVGWPRADKTGFLEKLKEIWAQFGDGLPHDVAPDHAPESVKDAGIDVLSWFPEADGQPGHGFVLGQVASGANWKDKSIRPDIEQFMALWFQTQPVSHPHPIMFIPFLLDPYLMLNQTPRHGYILDRGRLPAYAAKAFDVVAAGVGPVERLDEAVRIQNWLRDQRAELVQRWAA